MSNVDEQIRMQPPSDGCACCGGPVRTYKPNGIGWVCISCVREGRYLLPGHETPGQLRARERQR